MTNDLNKFFFLLQNKQKKNNPLPILNYKFNKFRFYVLSLIVSIEIVLRIYLSITSYIMYLVLKKIKFFPFFTKKKPNKPSMDQFSVVLNLFATRRNLKTSADSFNSNFYERDTANERNLQSFSFFANQKKNRKLLIAILFLPIENLMVCLKLHH